MSFRAFVFTIALAPALLLGQLNSNTVTVTASQNSDSQPDQAIFNVTVNAGIDKSLDDIVKALASVGISTANLAGITYQSNLAALTSGAASTVGWTFQLPVALSMQKQTLASLAALEQTIAQADNGLSLSFSLAGIQNSDPQTQNCNYSTLIANAQAQAQQLASAAGSAANRITGISGTTSNGVGVCSATVTFGLGYAGSPGPHAISITASRTGTAIPDQILMVLTVTSGIAWGLDDIAGALTQAGVTGMSFSNVYTAYTYDNRGNSNAYLQWSFTLATPLTALKNAIGQLLSAEAALSKRNSGVGLSFSTGGLQASPQGQPACSQGALIADATAQAQALAGAAGVPVGPVKAISNAGVTVWDPLGVPGYAPSSTCSMLVQFQLN
ncbi:MAG TPA: SIMPL domain-containing protein [Bryobacteraceae bacterium]|nr:SIMPL domain-containing protein [Bryobacteraceae bacterium]